MGRNRSTAREAQLWAICLGSQVETSRYGETPHRPAFPAGCCIYFYQHISQLTSAFKVVALRQRRTACPEQPTKGHRAPGRDMQVKGLDTSEEDYFYLTIQGLFVPCVDTDADSFQFRSRHVGRKEITQSGSPLLASEQHSSSGALERPAACKCFPSW